MVKRQHQKTLRKLFLCAPEDFRDFCGSVCREKLYQKFVKTKILKNAFDHQVT
jgi:hypothetical protein